MASVRLRDGIEIELASGETIVCDGHGSGDAAATVLSHAHGDHLVDDPTEPLLASPLTVALADERSEGSLPAPAAHPAVDLLPAGHVAGSRAALITDPDTGERICYTGDCSTRDRFYLEGFTPVDADVLVVESTYGRPGYAFPPTDEVVARMRDWLADAMDTVVVLFGYALGRAQKLQRVLADSARTRTLVTDAVADLNAAIEAHRDVSFDAERYGPDVDLEVGDALVLPMGSTRLHWVEALIERHDARTVGASGWAVDRSFRFRRGYDEGFALSDHCDFPELVELVRAVDPERVYTHHGFADDLATHLRTECGYEARSLKRDQTTLEDF